jgi:hypothetical protein
MLLAVATTKAQTLSDDNPPKLPANLTEKMVIEQVNRGTINATLIVTFNRNLSESEIELVKGYVLYFYHWKQPIDNRYNANSPDIDNTKKCVMKFYKF